MLRGGLVLIDQPAEELSSTDLVRQCREGDYVECVVVGGAQAESASLVAAPGVVVVDVFGQDDACVSFADDEHPVGEGPGLGENPTAASVMVCAAALAGPRVSGALHFLEAGIRRLASSRNVGAV